MTKISNHPLNQVYAGGTGDAQTDTDTDRQRHWGCVRRVGLAISAAFEAFMKAYPKTTDLAAQFGHKEFDGAPREIVDMWRACLRQLLCSRFQAVALPVGGRHHLETWSSPLAPGRGVAFLRGLKSQSSLMVSVPTQPETTKRTENRQGPTKRGHTLLSRVCSITVYLSFELWPLSRVTLPGGTTDAQILHLSSYHYSILVSWSISRTEMLLWCATLGCCHLCATPRHHQLPERQASQGARQSYA